MKNEMFFFFHFGAATIIRIGFEHPLYDISVANTNSKMLFLAYIVREENQKTEQTYFVDISIDDLEGNSAIIHTYNINNNDFPFDQTNVTTLFPPTVDRIPLVFSLNYNSSEKGTVTFQVISSQFLHSRNFQNAFNKNAFSRASIHITVSDDGKF